ncbi:MAG: succinate dehydrogenase iron-sulfur subunit [Klebsiella grimontii]|nr:succinate dehydrogenase iron-sulfur subunit [Klebsiella grimontii]
MKLEFSVYRYNPDVDDAPRMQDYTLEAEEGRDMMLLDALIQLKEKDPSLSFRRSCREGVCGSDGLNMNGKNGLACITPISALNQPGKKIVIRPLPGLPVIRDLVVDMGQFYAQYEKIKPYLLNNGQNPPLLAAYRFLIDSRDTETSERLEGLSDAFSVFRCHSIMNCVSVCPKGLNPTRAIGHIKSMLLQRSA